MTLVSLILPIGPLVGDVLESEEKGDLQVIKLVNKVIWWR